VKLRKFERLYYRRRKIVRVEQPTGTPNQEDESIIPARIKRGDGSGRGGRSFETPEDISISGTRTGVRIKLRDNPGLQYPKVIWLEGEQVPEYLTGMAATYVAKTHEILVNKDFQGFQDVKQMLREEVENVPDIVLEDTIRDYFGVSLIESVMRIKSFGWLPDKEHLALSTEALTVAVMPIYGSWGRMKAQLTRYTPSPSEEVLLSQET
jgi:hypothetical protein